MCYNPLMEKERSFGTPEFNVEEAAKCLNRCFEYGDSALDHTRMLSRFPKPILLDFNNVLANNYTPLILNPHAHEFFNNLNQMGNVVILTSASGWTEVNKFLVENNLWNEKNILMTLPTWQFAFDYTKNPQADALCNKYIELRNNPAISKEVFKNENYGKKVAPLFMKNHDIPLVDDYWINTDDNPGIEGIRVEPFEPDEFPNYTGETLSQALEKVDNFYKSLGL